MQDLPNLNLDYELLKNTIVGIIENIEIWDNSLSFLFSDCLGKLIEKMINNLLFSSKNVSYSNSILQNTLINMILKFYIIIIENNETDMTLYFIRGFNDIVETLSKYQDVIVDQEIIEKASAMGSFGKKNNLRKYSLFFCTCLIRVFIIFIIIRLLFN